MIPLTFSLNYPWKVHKMMTGNYLGVKPTSCLLCQLPTRKKYLPTLTQSFACFSGWHSRPKVRLNVVLCKFKQSNFQHGNKMEAGAHRAQGSVRGPKCHYMRQKSPSPGREAAEELQVCLVGCSQRNPALSGSVNAILTLFPCVCCES